MTQHRLLFVCLGNICRSPLAQGVFAHVADEAGIGDRFFIDSAGTEAWNVGNPPDARSQSVALANGIDLSGQRARQIRTQDFEEFDIIIAMDRSNHAVLLDLAPDGFDHKVHLFLGEISDPGSREVPDPYYGGVEGFKEVFDMVDAGARALLARLR